jgi:glycosyltransferase involved in cell wall biosynthesis
MKIGVVTYFRHDALASLAHVRSMTAAVLQDRHELVPYPVDYAFASLERQQQLLHEWLVRCDAVVGPIDDRILQVRHATGCGTPYVGLLLGHLSRGAIPLATAYRYLRASDVLVGNCTADLALADLFLANAAVERVPFGFDASKFYPADQAAQRALRERWSIDPSEKLIVYAGRIALEKNVHTLLKAFRVVLDARPVRLVIAGSVSPHPFHELGAFPLGMMRMLRRLMAHLELDQGQVLFVGNQTPDDLRVWYSTADALANLTLNHDENFGLAQIDAMACGLPAVGTAWGGLIDTIVDGVTGYKVPTVVTSAGVKVDWWRAAGRLLELLDAGPENRTLRESCRRHVQANYSMTQYQCGLEQAIERSVAAAATDAGAAPLQPTPFAQRFWKVCFGGTNGGGGPVELTVPPYRRGDEAWDLYRHAISRFTDGSCDDALSPAMARRYGWCLVSPFVVRADGIAIDDPIFPRRMPVPAAITDDVRRLAETFTEHSVVAEASFDDEGPAVRDALTWMHKSGLILRTVLDGIEPARAHRALGQPAFVIQEIDQRADILAIA